MNPIDETTLRDLAKINQDVWNAGYQEGLRYGAETMAYRAIQIRNQMKDKKSLAGNLWHSDEEIEDAINNEAEKISTNTKIQEVA